MIRAIASFGFMSGTWALGQRYRAGWRCRLDGGHGVVESFLVALIVGELIDVATTCGSAGVTDRSVCLTNTLYSKKWRLVDGAVCDVLPVSLS
jgi:hypothetical protein